MTENTATVVESTSPAKKVSKKVVKKVASKKVPAKKVPAKKAAAKAAPAERAKKDGLRKSQVAILQALSKAKNPVTRIEIAELAEVDKTKVGVFAGPRLDTESEKTKATFNFPGLYELGFVKCEVQEGTRGQVYTITPAGRKALEAALKG